ncbi:MAG: Ku protein [Actinobacteria bacterium]|nr:Ku protein [Actinomycetota bacterium]
MPRPIWSGTITFGLVTVPVKLVTATRSQDVRFNQLEEGTGSRIRYRKVSEATGEEVPNEKIVKGYEISPGQYVVVGGEEMDAFAPKATRMIEIEDFVDLEQIDPIFYDSPYYLTPDRGAAKPYRLLLDAMADLDKVAIGRFVLRGKEHLVAIRVREEALCVETMRYVDEVVPVEELEGLPEGDIQPTKRELDMARQLIEALSGDFEPEKYHDQYREQLRELIEKKAAGEEIVAEPLVEEPAKVVDLMAALEASLERAGKGGAREAKRPARKAATKKPAKSAKKKATRSRKSA